MRVLLVGTDTRVASTVRQALEDGDTEVVEAFSPHRALDLVDAGEGYDVVVADADMTPEGGFALSRELKAREQMSRDIPPVVLLVTRYEDAWLSSWSRADAFVRKPVDPFDLAEVVAALVEGGEVPQLPGVGVPKAPVAGDIFGIDEGAAVPETAINAGP